MDIAPTTSARALGIAPANAGKTTSSGDASALGYDAFLKLLIAQMQNQDPMKPMDSSDYVAQLATFSQVERTIQTNGKITELLSTVRLQQAESLIGRSATAEN